MIKMLNKPGIKRNFLNRVKTYMKNLQIITYSVMKNLKLSVCIRIRTRMPAITTSFNIAEQVIKKVANDTHI